MRFFNKDESGSILVFFVLSLLPMLYMTALVVDASRAYYLKSRIVELSENAALAAADAMQQTNSNSTATSITYATQAAQDSFNANSNNQSIPGLTGLSLSTSIDSVNSKVTVTVNGTYQPIFSTLSGQSSKTLTYTAYAKWWPTEAEIAVALWGTNYEINCSLNSGNCVSGLPTNNAIYSPYVSALQSMISNSPENWLYSITPYSTSIFLDSTNTSTATLQSYMNTSGTGAYNDTTATQIATGLFNGNQFFNRTFTVSGYNSAASVTYQNDLGIPAVQPLTRNKSTLSTYLTNLLSQYSLNTRSGTAPAYYPLLGPAWAWRTIEPTMRGSFGSSDSLTSGTLNYTTYPKPINSSTVKSVIIFMDQIQIFNDFTVHSYLYTSSNEITGDSCSIYSDPCPYQFPMTAYGPIIPTYYYGYANNPTTGSCSTTLITPTCWPNAPSNIGFPIENILNFSSNVAYTYNVAYSPNYYFISALSGTTRQGLYELVNNSIFSLFPQLIDNMVAAGIRVYIIGGGCSTMGYSGATAFGSSCQAYSSPSTIGMCTVFAPTCVTNGTNQDYAFANSAQLWAGNGTGWLEIIKNDINARIYPSRSTLVNS